jgi:hypothetical protein
MKLLLALTLLVMASSSFAKRPTTLEDYDASRSYIVAWPTVIFSNVSIPVKNVCVDGDNFKTIAPAKFCSESAVVEVCVKANHGSEECRPVRKGETPKQSSNIRLVWGCVAYKSQNFETTRSYEASVCTKWERSETNSHDNTTWVCVEHGTETKEYALSYDVSVTGNGNNHSGRVEVANLDFTIPQCK